jgi:hypothetical protein
MVPLHCARFNIFLYIGKSRRVQHTKIEFVVNIPDLESKHKEYNQNRIMYLEIRKEQRHLL